MKPGRALARKLLAAGVAASLLPWQASALAWAQAAVPTPPAAQDPSTSVKVRKPEKDDPFRAQRVLLERLLDLAAQDPESLEATLGNLAAGREDSNEQFTVLSSLLEEKLEARAARRERIPKNDPAALLLKALIRHEAALNSDQEEAQEIPPQASDRSEQAVHVDFDGQAPAPNLALPVLASVGGNLLGVTTPSPSTSRSAHKNLSTSKGESTQGSSILPSRNESAEPNPANDASAAPGRGFNFAAQSALATFQWQLLGRPNPFLFQLERTRRTEQLAQSARSLLRETLTNGSPNLDPDLAEQIRGLLVEYEFLPAQDDTERLNALRGWNQRFIALFPRLPVVLEEQQLIQRYSDEARMERQLEEHYAENPDLARFYAEREALASINQHALQEGVVPDGTRFSAEELGIPLPAGSSAMTSSFHGSRGLWIRLPEGQTSFSSFDGRVRVDDLRGTTGASPGDFQISLHDADGWLEQQVTRIGPQLLHTRYAYGPQGLESATTSSYSIEEQPGRISARLQEDVTALWAAINNEQHPGLVPDSSLTQQFDPATGDIVLERISSPEGETLRERRVLEGGSVENHVYLDGGRELISRDPYVTEIREPEYFGRNHESNPVEQRQWHFEVDTDLSGLAGQERMDEATRRAEAIVAALAQYDTNINDEGGVYSRPLRDWIFSAQRHGSTRMVITRRGGYDWLFELHELDAEGQSTGYRAARLSLPHYAADGRLDTPQPRVLRVYQRATGPGGDALRVVHEYLPNGQRMHYLYSVDPYASGFIDASGTHHRIDRYREALEIGSDQWRQRSLEEYGVAAWDTENEGTSFLHAIGRGFMDTPGIGHVLEGAGTATSFLYNGSMGLAYSGLSEDPGLSADTRANYDLHAEASLARAEGWTDPSNPDHFQELTLRINALPPEARQILEMRARESRRRRLESEGITQGNAATGDSYVANMRADITTGELIATLLDEHGAGTWGSTLARWHAEDDQALTAIGSIFMHVGEEAAQNLPLLMALHGMGNIGAARIPGGLPQATRVGWLENLSPHFNLPARVAQMTISTPFMANWAAVGIPQGIGDVVGGLREGDFERLSEGLGGTITNAMFATSMARGIWRNRRAYRQGQAGSRARDAALEAEHRRALGLEQEGRLTHERITRAYRNAALRHHPDKNPGDPTATGRFIQANDAYTWLNQHAVPTNIFARARSAVISIGGHVRSWFGGRASQRSSSAASPESPRLLPAPTETGAAQSRSGSAATAHSTPRQTASSMGQPEPQISGRRAPLNSDVRDGVLDVLTAPGLSWQRIANRLQTLTRHNGGRPLNEAEVRALADTLDPDIHLLAEYNDVGEAPAWHLHRIDASGARTGGHHHIIISPDAASALLYRPAANVRVDLSSWQEYQQNGATRGAASSVNRESSPMRRGAPSVRDAVIRAPPLTSPQRSRLLENRPSYGARDLRGLELDELRALAVREEIHPRLIDHAARPSPINDLLSYQRAIDYDRAIWTSPEFLALTPRQREILVRIRAGNLGVSRQADATLKNGQAGPWLLETMEFSRALEERFPRHHRVFLYADGAPLHAMTPNAAGRSSAAYLGRRNMSEHFYRGFRESVLQARTRVGPAIHTEAGYRQFERDLMARWAPVLSRPGTDAHRLAGQFLEQLRSANLIDGQNRLVRPIVLIDGPEYQTMSLLAQAILTQAHPNNSALMETYGFQGALSEYNTFNYFPGFASEFQFLHSYPAPVARPPGASSVASPIAADKPLFTTTNWESLQLAYYFNLQEMARLSAERFPDLITGEASPLRSAQEMPPSRRPLWGRFLDLFRSGRASESRGRPEEPEPYIDRQEEGRDRIRGVREALGRQLRDPAKRQAVGELLRDNLGWSAARVRGFLASLRAAAQRVPMRFPEGPLDSFLLGDRFAVHFRSLLGRSNIVLDPALIGTPAGSLVSLAGHELTHAVVGPSELAATLVELGLSQAGITPPRAHSYEENVSRTRGRYSNGELPETLVERYGESALRRNPLDREMLREMGLGGRGWWAVFWDSVKAVVRRRTAPEEEEWL